MKSSVDTCESAYRRGLHHGLIVALRLTGRTASFRQYRRDLGRAESIAAGFRRRLDHAASADLLIDRLAEHRRNSEIGGIAPGRKPDPSPLIQDVEPFHPGDIA